MTLNSMEVNLTDTSVLDRLLIMLLSFYTDEYWTTESSESIYWRLCGDILNSRLPVATDRLLRYINPEKKNATRIFKTDRGFDKTVKYSAIRDSACVLRNNLCNVFPGDMGSFYAHDGEIYSGVVVLVPSENNKTSYPYLHRKYIIADTALSESNPKIIVSKPLLTERNFLLHTFDKDGTAKILSLPQFVQHNKRHVPADFLLSSVSVNKYTCGLFSQIDYATGECLPKSLINYFIYFYQTFGRLLNMKNRLQNSFYAEDIGSVETCCFDNDGVVFDSKINWYNTLQKINLFIDSQIKMLTEIKRG